MKQRCNDPNSSDYHLYGAKGISVCDAWGKDYTSFREWAMSNCYSPNLTIDRIDNNGDYEQGNCRWVSAREQARNTTRNHFVQLEGETKTLAEWSEISGIESSLIRYRIKAGWTVKDAITITPNTNHNGGNHGSH